MTHPYDFTNFTEAAFEQVRPYAAADRNAALVYLQCLKDLVPVVRKDRHRGLLVELGHAFYAETESLSPRDRQGLETSLGELVRLQGSPEARATYQRQKQLSDGGG